MTWTSPIRLAYGQKWESNHQTLDPEAQFLNMAYEIEASFAVRCTCITAAPFQIHDLAIMKPGNGGAKCCG